MTEKTNKKQWGDVLATRFGHYFNDDRPDPRYYICLGETRRANRIRIIPEGQKTTYEVKPEDYVIIGNIKYSEEEEWIKSKKLKYDQADDISK